MKKLIYILLTVGLMWSCAKQGYPSGGPKDDTPPVAGTAVPPSGSTQFDAREFYIPFDEYVTIKDAENNVLISPPMKKKPEYVSKGKGIVVRLKDTLREGTTYLFQFKGAVADLNEGNVLESYEYAFSTGSEIDSMTFEGVALDALTLKPKEEAVSVMLYSADAADSAAAKENPIYITRTDKQGRFRFTHLKRGDYKILAIEDENKDLRFTSGEAIAWSDTLVGSVPPPSKMQTQDSVADSAAQGGPLSRKGGLSTPPSIEKGGCRLLLSAQTEGRQRVIKSEFLRKAQMQLVMQNPLKEYELYPLDGKEEDLVVDLNKKRDTLTVWSRNANCDSIMLVMHTDGFQDTLKLKMKGRGRMKNTNKPLGKTALVKNNVPQTTHYYDSIHVDFVNPMKVEGATDSIVSIRNMKDSSVVMARILTDSIGLHGVIDFGVVPGSRYEIRIAPDRLADIYGNKNDTVKIATEISLPEQYGRLIMTVNTEGLEVAAGGQYLIQLLNEKLDIIATQMLKGSGKVTFEHLKGGKYTVRAIADDNGNGQWDSGDYWQHRQPEKASYFSKTLDLRENWDIEETFEPKE